MKKIFIALSVLAALIFSVAPSQALLGVPDDVPGSDPMLPFFLASMPGHGNTNTLFVITDFKGETEDDTGAPPANVFHYTVYTKRSATVYDDNLTGTQYDIMSTDALSIINKLSTVDKAELEYDLDGDGTNDHYVGYINFERGVRANSVGAQILIVDLAKGMVSSANAPVREVDAADTLEAFSANGLFAGKVDQGYGVTGDPTDFGLYPRYYVNSANAECWLLMWKSFNHSTTAGPPPNDGKYHVYWYDNEENKVSASFDWPDELLIMNVNDYIPASLWAADDYPKEGFVAFELDDLSNVGFYGDEEYLGYTWLKDVGAASESWTVLNPVWRDAWNSTAD